MKNKTSGDIAIIFEKSFVNDYQIASITFLGIEIDFGLFLLENKNYSLCCDATIGDVTGKLEFDKTEFTSIDDAVKYIKDSIYNDILSLMQIK